MKTLREYIDILDEISRRDFLKGAGAAAAGAALGSTAKAEWFTPIQFVDPMTDRTRTTYWNASVDRKFILNLINVSGYGYKFPQLRNVQGKWKTRPAHVYSVPGEEKELIKSNEDYAYGRLRIDNMQVVPIRYAFPTDADDIVYIVQDMSKSGAPSGVQINNMIAGAKERILIDASDIGHPNVIEFDIKPIQQQQKQQSQSDRDRDMADIRRRLQDVDRYRTPQRENQSLEESEPEDPISKIDRLFRHT